MLDDSIDFSTSYLAMCTILHTQARTTRQRLSRHHSFGALKIYAFHTIMMTQFILHRTFAWLTREGLHALMLALHPFLPNLQGMIYWGTIAFTIVMLITVEAVKMYAQHKVQQVKIFKQTTAPYPLLLFEVQHGQPPLPNKFMVLSGIMLLQSFVGWLRKMGHHYWGFINSMHQIGTNAQQIIQTTNSTSLQTTTRRIDKTLLTIMMMYALPHSLASHLHSRSPSLQCLASLPSRRLLPSFRTEPTAPEAPQVWHFHLGDAFEDTPMPPLQDRSSDTSTCASEDPPMPPLHDPISDISSRAFKGQSPWEPADPLCLVTETTDIADVLILANSNTGKPDTNLCSFAPTRTEFGTDNCATHHICSQLELFISMDTSTNIGVKGVAGSSLAEGIGTVQFTITDEDGIAHTITLSNVIYLSSAAKNLISTSQWSRDRHDDCGVLSREKYSIFMWEHDSLRKLIDHEPGCAIPLMPVNKDKDAFLLFADKHAHSFIDNDNPILLLSDGSSDSSSLTPEGVANTDQQPVNASSAKCKTPPLFMAGDIIRATTADATFIAIIDKQFVIADRSTRYKCRPLNSKHTLTLTQDNIAAIRPDPADIPSSPADIDRETMTHCLTEDDMKQLWAPASDSTVSEASRLTLYWHHRLRCAPLRTLHRLSTRGLIPRCISKVKKMPLCASCAYAAAHRKGWRVNGQSPSSIRKPSHDKPGAGTSCDHIISHDPGLIPQSIGIMTHERFWGSVLYVDHYSDFMYNHLITGTTSLATLESKLAYERVAAAHGVTIKAYHADNLRFNDNNFKGSCISAGQQLSYCGVGAHHQNAVVESKIKEVSYGGRTILLHAKRKWPEVISTVLWPYAVQAIVERHNILALDVDGRSPLEKFTGIDDDKIPTQFHTWGCPVFILDAANQSGAIGTPKWKPRSHTGIYLGHSPCHAGSVSLVLNLQSGMVSPQFHVVYDDEFTTVPYLSSAEPPPNWVNLCEHAIEHSTNGQ